MEKEKRISGEGEVKIEGQAAPLRWCIDTSGQCWHSEEVPGEGTNMVRCEPHVLFFIAETSGNQEMIQQLQAALEHVMENY